MRAVVLALAMALTLAGSAAGAGQDDDRLDALFARLQETADPAEARIVEHLIWSIWYVYEGAATEVRTLMLAGEQASRRRDYGTAEQIFDEVVDLDPSFAEGWNRRATVRYLRGDYVGSIADIRVTLSLEPRHFGALSGLGLCYMALEESERAIAAFEAALALNPHMPGPRAHVEALRERLSGAPI